MYMYVCIYTYISIYIYICISSHLQNAEVVPEAVPQRQDLPYTYRKVDISLPGKGNSHSHGARRVH